MKQLILHIPHASTQIPDRRGFLLSGEALQEEILKLTDWYTDELFANNQDEAVIAPFSRVFCDVERFTDDSLEPMAKYGMGVLYEKTDEGKPMRHVSAALRFEVVEKYYNEHHQGLTEAVERQLKQYNRALLIDCHSFPIRHCCAISTRIRSAPILTWVPMLFIPRPNWPTLLNSFLLNADLPLKLTAPMPEHWCPCAGTTTTNACNR